MIDRIEMLDMAIDMLNQVKTSHESIERIVETNDISAMGFGHKKDVYHDRLWAKYIYEIIRSSVGLLEINTNDIDCVSQIDFSKDIQTNEDKY